MNKKFLLKTKESLTSVLPITLIILLLNFTVAPMPFSVRGLFILGAVILVPGMGFFTLGADFAMMPMGELIGAQLTKSRKLVLLIGISFILGLLITMAEPDLQILANRIPAVPDQMLILWVALGVGVFLAFAVLRILFQWNLSYMLIICYGIIFLVGMFTSENHLSVAFDSRGVTTGPIILPFILALGTGISSVRGGKHAYEDSFGFVSLYSVGPIMAIMVMGIFFGSPSGFYFVHHTENVSTILGLLTVFAEAFPQYAKNVATALSPVIIAFVLFQIFALKLPKSQLIKMTIGILYTYVGLVLFLTGLNVGFLPAAIFVGKTLGALSYNWILIPLGMVIGFFIVTAEPAVHILCDQVEERTGGTISKNAMLWSLSIGLALSIALAMIRILLGMNIWFILVPGYLLALGLASYVPKIFTAIAFDSGGVASGPMTATFLLPFAMGACEAAGRNMLTDAFGMMAMVAMTPPITIQVMGLIYQIKMRNTAEEEDVVMDEIAEEETLELVGQKRDAEIKRLMKSLQADSSVIAHQLYHEIIADNDYIDFEQLDKTAFFSTPEHPIKEERNHHHAAEKV